MSEETNIEEVKEETQPSLEDRIVAAAKEQGWREGGELDAFEFINRGSEFHRDLKRRLDESAQENRKLYGIVAEHIQNTKKKEYQEASSSIEAQIRAAAESGDTERVLALTKQAREIKEPDPIKDDPKMSYVDDWYSKNDWMEKNPNMKYDAQGFYLAERERIGVDDPERILPVVERKIKEIHKDYFTPVNPNREVSTSASSTGKKKTSRSSKYTLDDLDDDERRHIQEFVKYGMKEEDLIASAIAARRS